MIWVWAVVAMAQAAAWADIIHLKTGEKIEGRIVKRFAGTVQIETAEGLVEVDEGDIANVETKPWNPPEKKPPKGPDPRRFPGFPDLKPAPKVNLPQVDRDPFENYRILFPEGWSRGDAPHSWKGPEGQIQLLIEREKSAWFEAFQKKYPDAKVVEEKDLKIGPHAAKRALVRYTDAEVMRMARVSLESGDRRFILTLAAPEDKFEAAGQIFDMVAGTIRVFPEHPLSEEQRAEYQRRHAEAMRLMGQKLGAVAIKELDELKKLVPNYPELFHMYYLCHGYASEWTKAADALRQAARMDPDAYEYHFNLCQLVKSLNKLSEAEKEAIRAAELRPWSDQAWTLVGTVYMQKQDSKKAKEALRRALEINPKSVPAMVNLGILYESQGDLNNAVTAYQAALKFGPENETAKQGLERVEKSRKK